MKEVYRKLETGLLDSMTFQARKIKFLNFMTYQVFHDPYYLRV